MKTGFRSMHPISAFIFYIFVFTVSITASHPLILGISLVTALTCDIKLRGTRALKFFVKFLIPLCIAAAIINGFFNPSGASVLFILPWGKSFTAEAMLYGFIIALRTSTVIIWLFSFNEVITNDRIIYLFGRISPKTALVISMALRFIPLISTQAEEISKARRGIGAAGASKGLIKKFRSAASGLSVLVTWTLERGIDTRDSMNARGFGLKGRTCCTPYFFTLKDALLIAAVIAGTTVCIITSESFTSTYTPVTAVPMPRISGFLCAIFVFLIMIFPFIYDVKEERKWSISQ